MAYTLKELKAASFNATMEGMTATREFLLDNYDEIDTALGALLGTQVLTGGGFDRTNPHHFPGKSYLVLDSVQVDPFNDELSSPEGSLDTPTKCCNGARLTLNYKTQEWDLADGASDDPDVPNETYITHRISKELQVITLPRESCEWEFPGTKVTLADGTSYSDDFKLPHDVRPIEDRRHVQPLTRGGRRPEA